MGRIKLTTTEIMKTTAQKLNMTLVEYEEMIFSFYSRWCVDFSINTLHYQQILANTGINLWFLTELRKQEAEFHLLTERYNYSNTVTVEDLKRCYNECTFQMFNIRPMALLEEIKKEKVVQFKTQGIPVYNPLNSN